MFEQTNYRNLILGIDPGFTGALALYNLDSGDIETVIDMPVKEVAGWKEVDAHALTAFITAHSSRIVVAALEKVGARPGEGGTSIFRFGQGYGSVIGVLAALHVFMVSAEPSVWKALMGVSANKKSSHLKAIELFPFIGPLITGPRGGILDGRAEAILLAKFAERITGQRAISNAN